MFLQHTNYHTYQILDLFSVNVFRPLCRCPSAMYVMFVTCLHVSLLWTCCCCCCCCCYWQWWWFLTFMWYGLALLLCTLFTVIDMYMSYRWRESFNTVRFVTSSQRGLTCVGAECGKEGGEGGMDHTSVAALTNQLCSGRSVVRVFEYSINVLYYRYGRNQSWRY